MIFGRVTGIGSRMLGNRKRAADALGLAPVLTAALQRIVFEELAASPARRPVGATPR